MTLYQEFALPGMYRTAVITTLEQPRGLMVGLAVIRNRQAGAYRCYGQAPVRLARAAYSRGSAHQPRARRTTCGPVVDAFEPLSMPAFVRDASRKVVRLTPRLKVLCASGAGLTLRHGKLVRAAYCRRCGARRRRFTPRPHPGPAQPRSRLVVRPTRPDAPLLMLDVQPLPRQRLNLRPQARVLIVVRAPANDDQRRATVLHDSYRPHAGGSRDRPRAGSRARSRTAIARARGVSVGTVRVQIKSLLAKAGVNRQVELLARLANF